jgi:sarcosine oxidase, subunit gamma
MASVRLRHESPFDAALGGDPREIAAPGVIVGECAIAAQIAVTGDMAAAAATLGAIVDQVPPAHPNHIAGKDPYLLWLAPDKRLIASQSADRFELTRRLTAALAGKLAAVSDVTDGMAALDILGPRARDLVAMGCGLDLDPQTFTPLVSARTVFANQPVLIYPLAIPEVRWEPGTARIPQLPNRGYRLHIDRSLLHYLWKWLKQSATALT